MTYFADGSPYAYRSAPSPPMKNAGWLGEGHPFPTGDVPEAFVDRLVELVQQPVNRFRGTHLCEVCPPEAREVPVSSTGVTLAPYPCLLVCHAGEEVEVGGNGEVRVAQPNGVCWAAPVMVAHYVVVHHYLPPDGFVDAVMRGTVLPDPGDPAPMAPPPGWVSPWAPS